MHLEKKSEDGMTLLTFFFLNMYIISGFLLYSFFRKVVTERNKKLDDLQKTHTVLEDNVSKLSQQSNGTKNGSSGGITKATMVQHAITFQQFPFFLFFCY